LEATGTQQAPRSGTDFERTNEAQIDVVEDAAEHVQTTPETV
jgi:hypothetical protein